MFASSHRVYLETATTTVEHRKSKHFDPGNRKAQGTKVPFILATKMAGVVFTGSSSEEIEFAKKFWKSVDLLPKTQSNLIVPDISQRTETNTGE